MQTKCKFFIPGLSCLYIYDGDIAVTAMWCCSAQAS